jgi:MFS family permease
MMIFTRLRYFFLNLSSYFLPGSIPVSPQLQSNFRHLYYDIGWFGVTTGSALSFLTIYAARLGATTTQVGLINAMPAIVILFLALPAGAWLERRPITRSVFLSAMGQRIFYLFMALLPWVFSGKQQIWALIWFTLLMSVPGSVISIGFNVLFASAVPSRYRGIVAAKRNAVSAIVTVITSIICGKILTVLPFPIGYQVVFALAFIGGLFSALHLWKVKPVVDYDEALSVVPVVHATENEKGFPGKSKTFYSGFLDRLNIDALKGPFGKSLLLLTIFHFVHFLSIPIFPVFYVKNIQISDQAISTGTAIFYMTMFLGSTQIGKMVQKLGNLKATGIGIILLGLYPALLSFASNAILYYVASFFGGFAWSIVNVAMINYLLEKVPSNRRTGYLAWFSLAANGAVLLGTMLGPVIGNMIGLAAALLIFGILRTLSGIAILKWG